MFFCVRFYASKEEIHGNFHKYTDKGVFPWEKGLYHLPALRLKSHIKCVGKIRFLFLLQNLLPNYGRGFIPSRDLVWQTTGDETELTED